MGKAVQHPASPCQPGNGQSVILLVQEKTGFLAVFHVYPVKNSIFADLRDGIWEGFTEIEPALVLLQALQLPDGHVVALKNAADRFAVLAQRLHQQGEQQVFDFFHSGGQGLGDQDIGEAVHRQPWEAVGLAEDDAAAGGIACHDGFAVRPGVLNTALPEGLVEAVVGVAGDQPHPDLALAADKTRAKIFPFFADGVHQGAVFACPLLPDDFVRINPGVPLLHPTGALGGDDEPGEFSLCFH